MLNAVFLWLVAPTMGQTDGWERLLARASELLDRGAVSEALRPLTEAHALNPESADVLWMLGLAHRELGRFDEGLPYVEAFVETVPNAAAGHLLMATYREALGNPAGALSSYRAVLAIEPGQPQALHALALFELSRGDPEGDVRARELLERVLESYPDDPRALVPLGTLYFRQGRTQSALEMLRRAVQADPRSYDANLHLGALYSKLGRYELAARHLEVAHSVAPDEPATLLEMGVLHERLEELSEAKVWFERALETEPENAEVHYRLARIYHYDNAIEKAERAYLSAIRLDQHYAPAYVDLGRLQAESGRPHEAVNHFQRALELQPGLAEVHHLLARVEDQLGHAESAREHFEIALSLAPFAPEPRLNFGNFLVRCGEAEKGRSVLSDFRKLKAAEDRLKALKAAVNFDPADPDAKRRLIEFLLEMGRRDEALEEAQRFVALATMEPVHHVLLAQVLEARGNVEQALEVLARAVVQLSGASELTTALEELRRRTR